MFKTNLLLIVATSAFIFTACGGSSSSNSNSIKDKKYIIVIHHAPKGACESSAYRDTLKSEGFEDFITKETRNNTTCSDYGRVNDNINCKEDYYIDLGSSDDTACIVGFNGLKGYDAPRNRKTNDYSLPLNSISSNITNLIKK